MCYLITLCVYVLPMYLMSRICKTGICIPTFRIRKVSLCWWWCSVAKLRLTLCGPMNCSMPGFPVYEWLQEPAQIHVHWVGDAIQLISHFVVPVSSCLQSFPSSGYFSMNQFFASGGQSMLSFSFSISPSSEYSGLISFRIDWFDLLAL